MSAPITTRLLRLRPTTTTKSIHHFSTTPNNPPIPPQPESDPLDAIKSTLNNRPRFNLSGQNPPRFNFSGQNQQTQFRNVQRFSLSPPGKTKHESDLNNIKQNLSQFRLRTAPPPPPGSQQQKPMSISEIYSNTINNPRNINIKGFNSNVVDREEMGKKLSGLRPENRMGEWFSIQELSDRLARLEKIEKEEQERRDKGNKFAGVRNLMTNWSADDAEKERIKNQAARRLESLSSLGGTPTYMMHPPKEDLLEQYFHPDNMSSAEKMKLELKKVRDEFKMSESDCGSARVQVAQLTTKIKHLSTVLAKKDKHSRKGLQEMVQKRKKLLKYLRRTDWDSYSLVLSKLGLRDNPEIKAEYNRKSDNNDKKKKRKKKGKKQLMQ